MTDREVMQQALYFVQRVTAWEGGSSAISGLPDRHGTLTALRTALEQPEQQAPFSPEAINTTQTAWRMGYEAAKAEQQAEPEQMPTMAQQIEDARHLERLKPRLKK